MTGNLSDASTSVDGASIDSDTVSSTPLPLECARWSDVMSDVSDDNIDRQKVNWNKPNFFPFFL